MVDAKLVGILKDILKASMITRFDENTYIINSNLNRRNIIL